MLIRHAILPPLIRIVLFGLFGFAVTRLNLYLSYPDYFNVLNTNEVAIAFLKGIQFDIATLATTCLLFFILLLLPFKAIQKNRIRLLASYAIGIILFILFAYSLIDTSYFGEVKRHIGSEILNISHDIGAISGIAFSSRLGDTIRGVFILLGLWLIWSFFVIKPIKQSTAYLPSSIIIRLICFLLGAAFLVFAIRGFIPKGRPLNIADAFTQNGKLQQANLILNPTYLTFRESQKRLHQTPLKLVDKETLSTFEHNNPQFFTWQNPQAIPSKKNIVFILLESWTYKYIDSLSGSHYQATPFFDSLVKQSQVWDNYYAAGQRSIIGIQSVLSSIPALPNEPTIGFGLEIKQMSRIADIANQYNYRTIMMQTSNRRSFQMENIAKAQGFSEYYGKEDIPIIRDYPQEPPHFGWDYDSLQFLANQLINGKGQQPFFTFFFSGTTHEPFPRLPAEFEIYPHHQRQESGYLNALRYSDWSLQQFFNRIENEPWFKDTIFIFSADHTLNLLKDNPSCASNDKQCETATAISNEDFHIPLLIYTPDGSLAPVRHSSLASQYDLLPTMVDLLGFKEKIHTFGHSLFDTQQKDFVYLFQNDLLGMSTANQWLFFNEKGIQAQSGALDENTLEHLHRLKLKLQYADELIRHNKWAD
ncbi:sulfatase-like hydrolase/transferase [Pelistega sp. NLN82]|uniref:Sulfatase-like hydrolase/transferase n=1 Tax=Pelistega ratti TaxID=2652177 RepID=A0A6L9Y7L0_9BURK|nr:LTA synthase family protein [Pelistega ratti]NEN75758.1 sulfatase-like hydrolase/transferase [Pelistega ratti]